jgi:glycosyltransferase involved in cell wall biosynthesis
LATPQSKYPSQDECVVFQPQFVEFGGEERVILSLCRELHSQGKPHAVLCYQDHINLAQYAEWPLKVYQLNPGPSPLKRILSLRHCLQRIHHQGGPVPVLFNIQSAYHAGLAASAPYHLRIPDTFSLLGFVPEGEAAPQVKADDFLKASFAKVLLQFATRRGIRNAKQFVTNTAALRDEMQSLYGRSAEVIYLGGFGSPTNTVPERATSPIELLTVSRLQSSKRIDWILQSLADIKQSGNAHPAWRLHVAGSGPDSEALAALATRLGLAEQVIFHGFVSDAELQALYAQCHVFLMPAKQGYGLPAIEALYQKMGVVVSSESGVVEILDNTNWVAVSCDGQQGFSAALAEMLVRAAQPDFFNQDLPDLPIEKTWARKLITHYEW